MTGREHFERAASLLAWVEAIDPAGRKRVSRDVRRHGRTPLAECVAIAQAHAKLAEVALAAGMWDES